MQIIVDKKDKQCYFPVKSLLLQTSLEGLKSILGWWKKILGVRDPIRKKAGSESYCN